MANIKKFSFFKSYYESLKDLGKDDRNEIINAILEYVFEDKKPKFRGIKKTIWTLIEPNLNTSKNRSNPNSGAPLGNQNASKGKQSKNNQKSIERILGEGEGEGIGKGVGEGNNKTLPATPTEIFDYCFAIFKNYLESDMKKSCEKMFNHYEANNWKNIYNWKKKAEEWIQDDIDSGKIKMKEKEKIDTRKVYDDEDGRIYQLNSDGTKHYIN